MVRFYYPERISPERYDMFLANGWFRSLSMLFKNDLICMEEDLLSVVNVRLRLDDFEMKPRKAKNFKRVESKFRVVVRGAEITEEKQVLYRLNKHRFNGFINEDIGPVLFTGEMMGIKTKEVCVYDGETLIACSFFDMGHRAIAGLMGLFHPDYARYSLGIYTMNKEAEYGRHNGFKFYYPGYVLHGSDSFDYKLSIGRYDFMNPQGHWVDLVHFNPMDMPAVKLKLMTNALEEALFFNGVRCRKRLYPFFSMAYNQHAAEPLLEHPLVLQLPGSGGHTLCFAAWDMKSGAFVFGKSTELAGYEYIFDSEQSLDYRKGKSYLRKVFGRAQVRHECQSPGEMAALIADFYKSECCFND